MTYEIRLSKKANKELQKLSPEIAKRISIAIYKLASNPRAPNARSMVGSSSWRLRIGDYRVVYDIDDEIITVLVIRIGHRKNIYRKLG